MQYPDRARRLMLIDTVSYDSWPSVTWQTIIREKLDSYAATSGDEFEALLTKQLKIVVADETNMESERLRAYLAPYRTALGRTSFFEHQVRHYDSKYTSELTEQLRELTLPVRILWGQEDQWQPTTFAERLAADIPNAELASGGPEHRTLPHAPPACSHRKAPDALVRGHGPAHDDPTDRHLRQHGNPAQRTHDPVRLLLPVVRQARVTRAVK